MTDPVPIDPAERILRRTPARLLVGRAGTSYPTAIQLGLRVDHAAAVDAVRNEVTPELLETLGLLEVRTRARDKSEYLLRPDLGRRLDDEALATIARECPRGADIQVVVGDGLSAAAVAAQVPTLLPALRDGVKGQGWTFGCPFFVRYCRVGVMNDIGETLDPAVVVLLVGERPGLATAESLSAYFGFRPRREHTDAHRNLISNIHARGVPADQAVPRILALAGAMIARKLSGVALKEGEGVALPRSS